MKKIVLLFSMLLLSVTVFSQKETGTIINIGCSDNNDYSIMISDNLCKSLYAGVEYVRNPKVNKDDFLLNFGVQIGQSVILGKVGQCYEYTKFGNPSYETVTFHQNDYGVEYLFVNPLKKMTLTYGMSYTDCNGVEVKLGILF